MDPSVPQAVLEMGLMLLLASMVLHKTGKKELAPPGAHSACGESLGNGQGLYNPRLLCEWQNGSCKGVSKEPSNSTIVIA